MPSGTEATTRSFTKDDVWMYSPNKKYLVSPTEVESEIIQEAQSFSISIVNCVVPKNFESRRGDRNDILIVTRSSIGTNPRVEKVHFWEKDIPDGVSIDNIFAENVVSVDDYNGDDVVWIEWNVLEVDTDDGTREKTKSSLRSLLGAFGAAFPVLAPYSAASASVVSLLDKVVSQVKKDEYIIQSRFSLRSGGENGGRRMPGRSYLQTGTYVAFEKEVYGQAYKLGAEAKVWTKDDIPPEEAYIVFDVVPKKEISHDNLVGERIAKLMTQIRDKKETPSGAFTVDFLGETLNYYTNFKKLERYNSLSKKRTLSASEQDRLKQLSEDPALKELLSLFNQ